MGMDGFGARAVVATLSLVLGCGEPAPRGDDGARATRAPLVIGAKCRRADPCRADNTDLFFDVTITNASPRPIGFPLAFVQKTGPVIRISDTKTDRETFLRTNPADLALRQQLTTIAPGATVAFPWVIHAVELEGFGPEPAAEITVHADISVDGQRVDFSGSTTLPIRR
jgi:hypothetical protein